MRIRYVLVASSVLARANADAPHGASGETVLGSVIRNPIVWRADDFYNKIGQKRSSPITIAQVINGPISDFELNVGLREAFRRVPAD
jgi:hypothetical protein